MKIFKLTLLLACFLAFSLGSFAIPAYPGKMKAPQADGTFITIQRLGDEHCNIIVSDDGYPLLFNSMTNNFEYASLKNGALAPSGIIAADPALRSADARRFLSTVDKDQVMALFNSDWSKAVREASSAYTGNTAGGPKKIVRISDVPTTGAHDVLVILVQFANRSFTTDNVMSDPVAYYDNFFHQKGFSEHGAHGSVYDYYRYGSNNRYDPQFKVYGPVTVKGNYADYAGQGGTANTYKLIQETVPLVDSLYDVDFRSFDTDSDGVVDNVYCIYAGYGQADSYNQNAIWPHSWNLSQATPDQSFYVDSVKIDRYTVSQEINGQSRVPVGIGTFVHEFGHVLGLGDHYNTVNSNSSNNVGSWDVMASGSYNDDQNCPPTFSAFERYSLGWTEPTELDATTDTLVDVVPYEDGSQSYRINVTGKDNEYFLIENRQLKSWDSFLPGHGMLVWHIDEDQGVWDRNVLNGDASHQHVDIVEAGRRRTSDGTDSDPFPGTSNVTDFNFTDWNGRTTFGFAWLRERSDSLCQFLLSNTDFRINKPEVTVDDIMGTTARVNWTAANLATAYNVFVVNDSNIVASATVDSAGYFDVVGLEPETAYTAQVVATLSSLRSDTATCEFTTLPRQIEEYTPEPLPTEDATATSFTARWYAVPVADSYRLTLFARHRDGKGTYGSGFDNYATARPNLPEGWSMTDYRSGYTLFHGEKSPAVRLVNDSSNLTVSVPGQKIDSVRFWHRPSKLGVGLHVDKYADGKWTNIYICKANTVRSFVDTLYTGDADSLRFFVLRDSGITGGYHFLDDVYLTYLFDQYDSLSSATVGETAALKATALLAPSADETSICSYCFDNLDPETNYAYCVTALLDDRTSLPSDTVNVYRSCVDGISSVTNRSAVRPSSSAVYDLQGRRVATLKADGRPDAVLPKGIYIVAGKKVVK